MQSVKRITAKYDFIKKQSAQSWCLQINRKTVYVPKSQGIIDLDSKSINMPYWLAQKAGIEENHKEEE